MSRSYRAPPLTGSPDRPWRRSLALAAANRRPHPQSASIQQDQQDRRDRHVLRATCLAAAGIRRRRHVPADARILLPAAPVRAATIEVRGIDTVLADETAPRRADVVAHVD